MLRQKLRDTIRSSVQTAPTVSAKSQGDWNAVKALVNDAVAVKTKAGKTHYGVLQQQMFPQSPFD